MNKEQILQNVTAIAEKCQNGGLLNLQEVAAVLETINALNSLFQDDIKKEEKSNND